MADKKRKNTVNHNPCRMYGRKTADLFVDGELEPELAGEFESHIHKCDDCMRVVSAYRKTGEAIQEHAEKVRLHTGQTLLQERILGKIRKKDRSPKLKWNWMTLSSKKILKLACVTAIIVFGVFLLYNDTARNRGPSAIVNSVDSETASIMIMETQKEKHTIIWFSRS